MIDFALTETSGKPVSHFSVGVAEGRVPGAERGVGLIEILIAVVVLSIGFLAAAQMQVQGMRTSQGAYYRSQAYFMASDIINRMRSNPDGVINGAYDNFTTTSGLVDPNCGDAYCSSAEMASQDKYDWSAYLYATEAQANGFQPTLPSSSGTTAKGVISMLDDGVYEITMTWSEQLGDSDTSQTLTINFAPQS